MFLIVACRQIENQVASTSLSLQYSLMPLNTCLLQHMIPGAQGGRINVQINATVWDVLSSALQKYSVAFFPFCSLTDDVIFLE